MLFTPDELRALDPMFVPLPNDQLIRWMEALECAIREYTNNPFHERRVRVICPNVGAEFLGYSKYFKVGDTVQIRNSMNDGLYVVEDNTTFLTLTGNYLVPIDVFDEPSNDIILIRYPPCVKEACLQILKWEAEDGEIQLTGEIKSEQLGRHRVEYFQDGEGKAEEPKYEHGYPTRMMTALDQYKRLRY